MFEEIIIIESDTSNNDELLALKTSSPMCSWYFSSSIHDISIKDHTRLDDTSSDDQLFVPTQKVPAESCSSSKKVHAKKVRGPRCILGLAANHTWSCILNKTFGIR